MDSWEGGEGVSKEGLQFQTSQVINGKARVPRGGGGDSSVVRAPDS